MGLKDIFKRQLRTVIEWKEQKTNLLFHQLETTTDEIKDASKLIVAPGQGCIIVYDGKVRGVLTEPNIYEMETSNHPFITSLLNLAQQTESEHKMRFYFFRTAEMVTLGACGNFSIVISDPEKMFVTLLGPISDYYSQDVQELVSSRIMTPLTTFLAEKAYTYREVDTHLMEMSEDLKNKTAEELERLGLKLTDFRINSVTFDEETLERIGRIANMTTEKQAAAEVDLDYVSMQKLEALRDAARNEGGLAGAGLQMGAGLQLAQDIFKTQGKENSRESEITDRLRKLKVLFNEQLITEEEYEKKKNEILSKL